MSQMRRNGTAFLMLDNLHEMASSCRRGFVFYSHDDKRIVSTAD